MRWNIPELTKELRILRDLLMLVATISELSNWLLKTLSMSLLELVITITNLLEITAV